MHGAKPEMRKATVYPPDAVAGRDDVDVVTPAGTATLDALFRERVRRNPQKRAYSEYDPEAGVWRHYSWADTAGDVDRWRAALKAESLSKGDRVAIRLRNCRQWVIFDQAALSLGLVVVPLYMADRPDNVNYVLQHSGAKLLVVESEDAWRELLHAEGDVPKLKRVVVLGPVTDHPDDLLRPVDDWITARQDVEPEAVAPEDLASIVYTSGTTGRPKGVMLSHRNMVSNAYSGLRSVAVLPSDILLSFLPLSHTLERTVGYYIPMMAGAAVVYNRSIPGLSEDFLAIKPTGIITVPRIFERMYSELKAELGRGPAWKRRVFELAVDIGWARFEYLQGRGNWQWRFVLWPILDALVARKVRALLGGRLRLAVVGGAPLPPSVSRVFIALGLNLIQGYGLTESSPCISINTLERNRPETIGLPVHGVEVEIGDNDELLARGANIMMGYWRDEAATEQVLDKDGWLRSGDQTKIDADGFISIIGRIKEILVLANGEKVPPADMESAIAEDALFEQSLVIGEQMPYLTALVVLNQPLWALEAKRLNIDGNDPAQLGSETVEQFLLERIRKQIHNFPGYARVRKTTAISSPWTVDNGLMTPTLKLKRARILEQHKEDIANMYEGHAIYK